MRLNRISSENEMENINVRITDRIRTFETFFQKSNDEVSEHQLHIIELEHQLLIIKFESALAKEKRRSTIKEEAGSPEWGMNSYFKKLRESFPTSETSETDNSMWVKTRRWSVGEKDECEGKAESTMVCFIANRNYPYQVRQFHATDFTLVCSILADYTS